MIKSRTYTDTRNMDKLDVQLPRNAQSASDKAADAAIQHMRANWHPTSPSPRGGPPAKVSGRLERSIEKERVGRSVTGQFARRGEEVSTGIYVRAPYAGRLELGDLERPFLKPAMDAVAGMMDQFYKGVFRIG